MHVRPQKNIRETNRVLDIIHSKFIIDLAHLRIATSVSDQSTILLHVFYLEMSSTSRRNSVVKCTVRLWCALVASIRICVVISLRRRKIIPPTSGQKWKVIHGERQCHTSYILQTYHKSHVGSNIPTCSWLVPKLFIFYGLHSVRPFKLCSVQV